MTTTTKTPARNLAVLRLPNPVSALITLAKAIVQSMTGNASFPTPTPALADVTSAITDLQTAEAAALTRTKGTVATRNDKRAALVTLLQELKGYVQKQADANSDTSGALIQSSGMNVRKPAVRPPRLFAAKPGPVTGSIKLEAASAARRAAYEWQYSLDGGKTWLVAPSTLQARATVPGLTPGAAVMFKYRAVVKTGEGDWSQPVSIIVK